MRKFIKRWWWLIGATVIVGGVATWRLQARSLYSRSEQLHPGMPWNVAIETMGSRPVVASGYGPYSHSLIWKDDRYEIRVDLRSDYTVLRHEAIDHHPPFPWLRWLHENLKAWTRGHWR
jgi:hypothetical protein